MDTQAFHHWLAQLSRLSAQQKSTLNQALQNLPPSAVLEGLPVLQNCPHCQAKAERRLGDGRGGCAATAAELAAGRAQRCWQQAFPASTTPSAG